ncbi:hypothetical protein AMIS_26740 [Actinoplanes missouriensis 431]|uniref:Uncharacterized protein n=1 Tax=Actinoplanes missouriensis (strain ATCC 14538 / DSM 43046 / CBS 188.64 / JCM 3121 / NBRC 102363 / NCIMB 12654 / NRRL B-3342 / UNCC 431) TaxID=512565 RepID=I0H4F7_ACTM4|nr:hypothetical protein AMIS_26740 [Actinoplanes missouriensis 431]
MAVQQRLWAVSEDLTGVTFPAVLHRDPLGERCAA